MGVSRASSKALTQGDDLASQSPSLDPAKGFFHARVTALRLLELCLVGGAATQ